MTKRAYRAGDSFPVDDGGRRSPRRPSWHSYLFASVNSRVLALHREDGELRWSWKGSHSHISLFLAGDRLIVGANGYVTCLEPERGREIWHNPLKGRGLGGMGLVGLEAPSTSPAEKEAPPYADLLFLSFNKRVVALERGSGRVAWEWDRGSSWSVLLLDGDRLVVGSNGYVTCLDPRRGREMWSNSLRGQGLGCMSLASRRGGATAGQTQRQLHIIAQQSG